MFRIFEWPSANISLLESWFQQKLASLVPRYLSCRGCWGVFFWQNYMIFLDLECTHESLSGDLVNICSLWFTTEFYDCAFLTTSHASVHGIVDILSSRESVLSGGGWVRSMVVVKERERERIPNDNQKSFQCKFLIDEVKRNRDSGFQDTSNLFCFFILNALFIRL
jgi:hypothetical protein